MGSNYIASYSGLNSLRKSFNRYLEFYRDALANAEGAIGALVASGNISGATADRMRAYFSDIHGHILDSLTNAVQALDDLYVTYVVAYLSEVDSGFDFFIPSSKVVSIKSKMNKYAAESEQIDQEAAAVLNRISGVYSYPGIQVKTDLASYIILQADIEQMLNNMDDVESTYEDMVTSVLSDLLSSTRQTIQANIGQKAMHKQNYSPSDNGAEYDNMVAYTQSLNAALTNYQDTFTQARSVLKQFNSQREEYREALRERQRREEEIKNLKTGVAIASITVTGVVTIATWGTGTPFVVATLATGTGFGAINGGVDAYGKQYIENGNANLDWGEIGRGAFVGGVKGFATSAISLGVGQGFEHIGDLAVISNLTNSSSPFISMGTQFGLKVAEAEVTNISSNALGRFFDEGTREWQENGGSFRFDVDKGMDSAFDRDAIVQDAAGTFADTMLSFGVEEVFKGVTHMGKIDKDTKITKGMVVEYALMGGLSEVAAGAGSRWAGKLTEDLLLDMDFDDALEEANETAFDRDEMVRDAVTGTYGGGLKPYTTKANAYGDYLEDQKEIDKNTEKYGVANTDKERRIIEELRKSGEWDDYAEEGTKVRKNVNSGNTAEERKILAEMYENGEMEPTVDASRPGLSDAEKIRINQDFVDQNVRKSNLPSKNGKWSDPDKPGDSMWIPDDDATFTYKQGGEKKTMTYGELKKKYHIKGIEYRNNDPVFDIPGIADQKIGTVTLDRMPSKREGEGGSYNKFYDDADKRIGGDSKAYLEENGLTIHESADRRTVVAIPTEINAAFPHTGGIGMEKSMEAVASAWEDKTGGRGYTLSREPASGKVVGDFDIGEIKKGIRQFYNSYRK